MIQKVNSPFNESVKLFKIINSYLSLNFVVRFIMYVCWKSMCLYLCYIYLMIHKNQETNQNINVKVKLKTYFQLKFIFIMYPHGYTTRPSIYIKFIVFFKKIIRHKHSYKKIQLLLKTKKIILLQKKLLFSTTFDLQNSVETWKCRRYKY